MLTLVDWFSANKINRLKNLLSILRRLLIILSQFKQKETTATRTTMHSLASAKCARRSGSSLAGCRSTRRRCVTRGPGKSATLLENFASRFPRSSRRCWRRGRAAARRTTSTTSTQAIDVKCTSAVAAFDVASDGAAAAGSNSGWAGCCCLTWLHRGTTGTNRNCWQGSATSP